MNIISLDKSAHALFIKFPIIKPRKKSAPPIVVINPKGMTICINIFCDFGKSLDNKESINIGIPKKVGIIEVTELLPLIKETAMPHVTKKILKTIEKFIAFKPKNLNCWEMFSFIENPITSIR